MRLFAKICSLILLFGVLKSKAFNYKNADKWSEDYPECDGRYQSPINIPDSEKIQVFHWDKMLRLENYHVKPETMTLVNDGHSLKLLLTWGAHRSHMTGGPLGHDTFVLDHLQFHWGANDSSGSEHTIDGKGGALGVQFIHYNDKYKSYSDALDKKNSLAIVVGVYYPTAYTSSYGLVKIFNALDHPIREGDKIKIESINSMEYYEVLNSYEFYTYLGSLTTPPCSEIVTWFVDTHDTRTIAPKEMEKLRKFVELSDGDDHNNRPVQPLGNRQLHRVKW